MIEKLGLQLYTIREFMQTEDDIKRSFEKIKKLGYDLAQTAGISQVVNHEQFGKLAKDAGIEIVGTHEPLDFNMEDIDRTAANHKALGTTNCGIGGYWPRDGKTWEDGFADMKKFCGMLKEKGLNFTYHNHSHEFIKLDGKFIMQHLLDLFKDVDNMTFCLDTYWLQHGGVSILEWMDKLNGKVDILHLKEMQRFEDGPGISAIGQGSINWKSVIDKAEEIGVKYYVVEQDSCKTGDAFENIKISSDYLHANFM